jgi:hypothetical protein
MLRALSVTYGGLRDQFLLRRSSAQHPSREACEIYHRLRRNCHGTPLEGIREILLMHTESRKGTTGHRDDQCMFVYII